MTRLQIINKSLLRCGQRALQSLDETTADARLVVPLFDSVLEETLREGRFNSTIKRTQLVRLPNKPLFGYANAYQLPADSIRILDCYDGYGDFNKYLFWEIEDGEILANANILYTKYIYIPSDLQKLDATAAYALSLNLAKQIAYPKTENPQLLDSITLEYETLILQKAKSLNTLENNPEGKFAEADWLESRSRDI